MKRVALIGGAGFIGHHLALRLNRSGHEVVCIDSLMVNNLYDLLDQKYRPYIEERLYFLDDAKIPLVRMDARDYHLLSRVLADFKPDIVIHLAAIAHISVANKEPHSTFDHSLRTLENALDATRAIKAGFVFFSSSTVYGDFSKPVIDEDEPLKPKGIYGNLKLAGERICRAYSDVYGLPMVIIRPQALYGPRCASRRVIQVFIENAIQRRPILVNGDGSEEHDFTYITDLESGIVRVIDGLPFDEGMIKTYNLTGESATSLGEVAKIVTANFPTTIQYVDADSEKPKRGTMSCGKIRRDLGYEPMIDIRHGLNAYMAWYRRAWASRGYPKGTM